MALFLVLLFIVLPIAELYVIIQVAGSIGLPATLFLLIIDGFLGAALARSQGRTAWARFNATLAEGRVPAKETFDGAMIILGGAFLLAPGFITDVIGFLLLIPPTRAIFRAVATRLARRRVSFGWTVTGPPGGPGPGAGGFGGGPQSNGHVRDYDYEGTAREVTDPAGELGPGESDD